MATDPLDELKRRRSSALTRQNDPLEELKRRKTLMQDSALSPLLEETPFAVARPSLPSGPRASKPLPKVTTTEPAPKEFEKRLARAVREGTKKAEPFGREEELTPEQLMQRERARGAVAVAEDIGRSVAGQPARSIYRMATGIANIRNDPRAAALAESLRKIEEETAPQTAFGQVNIPLPNIVGGGELPLNLLRTGSEIGAFAGSGLLTAAARSGLESAAGKEFSTVGRGIENPLLRGLADASLDLIIPGALAARRGYKAVTGVGEMAGDAFTQGLRQGAGEAAEAATPSLARKDMYAPRATPETDPSRLLPRSASETIPSYAIPQIGTPSRILGPDIRLPAQMPAMSAIPPSVAPEVVAPRATQRIAGEAAAQRLAGATRAADRATPEEVVAYLEGKPLTSQVGKAVSRRPIEDIIAPMEERAANEFLKREAFPPNVQRRGLERIGRLLRAESGRGPDVTPLPESVLEQSMREATGEVPRLRGEEVPPFLANVPVDQVIREIDSIMGAPTTAASAGKAVPITKLSDAALEEERVRRSARVAELEAEIRQFDEKMVGVTEQFTGKPRSQYLTPQMRAANTRAKQVRNPVTGELLETAAERKKRERGISDEDLARLEEAGFADRDEYLAMRADINKKRLALNTLRKSAYTAEKEFVRRYNEGVTSGRIEGELLPEPVNPATPRSEKGAARAAEQKALDAENAAEMEALRAQRLSAIAAPGLLGAGVGGATGEEDSTMTPLQRALLFGAAGVVGGGAALRRFRAGRQVVTPSIPELAPIAETINVGKRQAAKEGESLLGRFEKFRNRVISETYVLEKAAERFGTEAQAKVVPELVAQQQGSRRAAEAYLEDTLTPIIAKLSKAEKDSVRSLLKARRELQILDQGGASKSGNSREVIERAVAAGNANQKIANVADQITAMHRDMLAKRYQAGLLTSEAYEAIKASDDFYTPFFREAAADPAISGMLPSRSGGMNILGSGVKKMDRTAEALEKTADPLETIVVDVARTYRDIGKQRVANVIFNISDKGDLPFLKRIPADPMNPPKGEGIIQQMRNGKLVTYKVTDKDLFNALAGQDAVATNVAVKFARLLKNAKTAGIVTLPDFAVANVIRDVALSGVQRPDTKRALREAAIGATAGGAFRLYQEDGEDPIKNFLVGAGLGAGAGLYARPLGETMVAMKSIYKNEKLFREFLADGGSTEGFFVRNADDAARILKRLEKEPGFSVQDIINPKSWWETLQKVGSIAEQSTRVAAYRQLREAGATGAEAALAAQDRTLRFANIGGSKSVKGLASVTPFWNAKIQGWDKLARMIKDPKTSALAAGMITAPSLALWTINKDNPEYWDRPLYERNLFWLVPKSLVGDEGEKGFYRIPKPFEIGYIFGSLPERALDYATQAGVDLVPDLLMPGDQAISSAAPAADEPGRMFARAGKEMAESTFEGTLPYPEIISLPTQLYMNRDFFRGRPIVDRPQLSPKLQVTEETSAIARALAQVGVSPQKTEFFIRNALGTAGAEGSKIVDMAARAAGLPAPEAKKGAEGIPLVGRFGERFTTSNKGQTDPEAFARERLRELNQVEVDYRELKRRAESKDPQAFEALVDFAMQNEADLELAKKIQPIETELEKLSRKRTEIRKDPRYSPEDRRVALEVLRERGQVLSNMLIGVRQP